MDWPKTITFAEAPALIGGCLNDPYEPDQVLELERIDIRKVQRWDGGSGLIAASAAYWRENPDPDEPPDFEGYEGLEQALEAGEEIPPVILQRTEKGNLVFVDGWHRMTIALHVGRFELWAYVAPPEADWNK